MTMEGMVFSAEADPEGADSWRLAADMLSEAGQPVFLEGGSEQHISMSTTIHPSWWGAGEDLIFSRT